jgi:MFS family permease
VLQVTGSAAALGTVLAIGGATLVATLAVSGVVADRVSRVRLMVASDVLRIVSQGTLATLLLTDVARLWHLVLLTGAYNVGMGFFQPARSGVLPQLLAPDQLVTGNGLMGVAESAVWTVGAAAGGVLVAAIGPGWVIAIDAGTFAVSALLLLGIGALPAPERDDPEGDRSFLGELREGWGEVRSRRWVWFTLLGATMYLLLYEGPMQVLGPIVTSADYSGARTWGLLLAAIGAGSAIGAVLAASGWLRRPLVTSLWLFLACAVVPALLLIGAPVWVLLAGMVVVGLSFGLFDPVWNAALQAGIPSSRISRVSAWDWMCSLAGMPIGMALAGWCTEAFGQDVVLAAMSVGTFAVCVLFLVEPAVRRIDDLARGVGDGDASIPVDSTG